VPKLWVRPACRAGARLRPLLHSVRHKLGSLEKLNAEALSCVRDPTCRLALNPDRHERNLGGERRDLAWNVDALFGSRARDDAGPDSDYDLLLVVADDASPEIKRSRLAYECLRETAAAADVLVWTRETFDSLRIFERLFPAPCFGRASSCMPLTFQRPNSAHGIRLEAPRPRPAGRGLRPRRSMPGAEGESPGLRVRVDLARLRR